MSYSKATKIDPPAPIGKYLDDPTKDPSYIHKDGKPPFKVYPLQESLLPQSVPRDFLDLTYKTLDHLSFPLEVRVWPSLEASSSAPWVMWCHGGGFFTGSHFAPPSWVIPGFRSKGFHVVSVQYRLGPHASMDDILTDAKDAVEWCKENLPNVLGSGKIDVNALAIGGDSGGGYLAGMLASLLRPQPTVLVSVYTVTDLTHVPENPALDKLQNWDERWGGKYSAEENEKYLAKLDPADTLGHCPFGWELENIPSEVTASRWGIQSFPYTPRIEFQAQLMNYCMVKGLLFRSIDPSIQNLKRYSSYHLLDECSQFPATAFLHGTTDVVPLEQSLRMAEKLRDRGVLVLESYEEGGPHAFDQLYTVRRQFILVVR